MEEYQSVIENQNILESVADSGSPPGKGSSAQKIPKPPLLYNNVDFAFSLLFLVLGFLFIKLILAVAVTRDHLGLGASVFTVCFIVAALIWFRKSGLRMDRSVWMGLIPIALTGSYFSIYQNTTLQIPALLFLMGAAAYFILTIGKCRVEDKLGEYLAFDIIGALSMLPFGNFSKLFAIQRDKLKSTKKGKSAVLLMFGILLTLPVSMYVGTLLQNADAAFERFWINFIEKVLAEDLDITVFQILISIPVSMYLYGLFYGSVKSGKQSIISREKASAAIEQAKTLPLYLVIGGITPLLLIYLLFFFSQTAYFLSAFSGYLPHGMIYSEYARRGFFELCQVSFINAVFVAVLLCFTKGGQTSVISRLYACILAAFSMALITMSLSKMLLYIDIYGLTPLRVYTSWFMVFLFILFILTVVRIFQPAFGLVRYCAAAGIMMFLLLCYADTDQIIASYNIHGYRTGRLAQLDIDAISYSGSSSTPYLIAIMKDEEMDEAYREQARRILRGKINNVNRIEEGDWRSATVAGAKESKALKENKYLIMR
ncbi:MAG: DUF4173 domain-containing protein [Peptococcaceae bacterium]|jgi:hypothetical protein|nr:DUF4173 domain-containing protein [Peptococcaceae bacterium]